VVPELTADDCTALLEACRGRSLEDRRDEAIVRLMLETGVRAGEVVAMRLDDVDLSAEMAVVRRSKSGRGHTVPAGPQTARAIDRYLRVRRGHRLADTPALWLGGRGKSFSYDGLYSALKRRAALAGVEGLHPHVLRHTAASRWLHAGGSEGGLMAVAGWSHRSMIDRYARSSSQKRAADEARRLGLGEW
jgi:integrase